jgi:nitrogen regulatory protein PII
LVKIVIQGSKVNDIKRDLRVCGINESTIFPDLDGLGRSINARWDIGDRGYADKEKDTK